uniref:hypothetical protein n=1 Tax=Arthrobacter sp. TaxID=1667 RepID=UPI00159EBB21|nr:hypothetical protein [Arthrobacter sp.]
MTDGLGNYIEKMEPTDERWWEAEREARFLASLSEIQDERMQTLKEAQQIVYRTAYRRTHGGVPREETPLSGRGSAGWRPGTRRILGFGSAIMWQRVICR